MEQKEKKILLIALAGIFVVILIVNVISGVKRGIARKAGEPKQVTQSEALEVMLDSDMLREPAKSRYESWGRDPFNIGKEASIGSPLKLEGIIWDDVKPFCIINGAALYVGSQYEGYTVTKINRQNVVVSDGAKETTLRPGGE